MTLRIFVVCLLWVAKISGQSVQMDKLMSSLTINYGVVTDISIFPFTVGTMQMEWSKRFNQTFTDPLPNQPFIAAIKKGYLVLCTPNGQGGWDKRQILDISDRIDDRNDRGLLSVLVHPDFYGWNAIRKEQVWRENMAKSMTSSTTTTTRSTKTTKTTSSTTSSSSSTSTLTETSSYETTSTTTSSTTSRSTTTRTTKTKTTRSTKTTKTTSTTSRTIKASPQPYIYIVYTAKHPDLPQTSTSYTTFNRLARFTLDMNSLNIIASSEVTLFGNCRPPQPGTVGQEGFGWGSNCSPNIGDYHAIAQVILYPSDTLLTSLLQPVVPPQPASTDYDMYVFIGDGCANEGSFWTDSPLMNSELLVPQDWNIPLGKVLRIHPETGLGLPGNPQYSESTSYYPSGSSQGISNAGYSARSKVYALGLRNVWRTIALPPTSFTPSISGNGYGTASSFIGGMVGYFTWESVVNITKGSNLGWPCVEGVSRVVGSNMKMSGCLKYYASYQPSWLSGLPSPSGQTKYGNWTSDSFIYVYPHNHESHAIIGGFKWPASFGKGDTYQFADYVTSVLTSIPGKKQAYVQPTDILYGLDQPTTFKFNPADGSIYFVASCHTCGTSSQLRRLKPANTSPWSWPEVGLDLGWTSGLSGKPIVANNPTKVAYTTTKTMSTLATSTAVSACVNPLINATLPDGFDIMSTLDKIPFTSTGEYAINKALNTNGSESIISIGGVPRSFGVSIRPGSTLSTKLFGACGQMTGTFGIDDETVLRKPYSLKIQGKDSLGKLSTLYSVSNPAILGSDFAVKLVGIQELFFITSLGDATLKNSTSLALANVKFYCGQSSTFVAIPKIITPIRTTIITEGQNVTFSGMAMDWLGVGLTPNTLKSNLRWEVDLVHGQGSQYHVHYDAASLSSNLQGPNGWFVAPTHDMENAWLMLSLRLYITGDGRGDGAIWNSKNVPTIRRGNCRTQDDSGDRQNWVEALYVMKAP